MGALPSGKNLGPDTSPSPKMYGLILQNMAEYIQNKHGDNMWKKVGNNRVKNLKPFKVSYSKYQESLQLN